MLFSFNPPTHPGIRVLFANASKRVCLTAGSASANGKIGDVRILLSLFLLSRFSEISLNRNPQSNSLDRAKFATKASSPSAAAATRTTSTSWRATLEKVRLASDCRAMIALTSQHLAWRQSLCDVLAASTHGLEAVTEAVHACSCTKPRNANPNKIGQSAAILCKASADMESNATSPMM